MAEHLSTHYKIEIARYMRESFFLSLPAMMMKLQKMLIQITPGSVLEILRSSWIFSLRWGNSSSCDDSLPFFFTCALSRAAQEWKVFALSRLFPHNISLRKYRMITRWGNMSLPYVWLLYSFLFYLMAGAGVIMLKNGKRESLNSFKKSCEASHRALRAIFSYDN